MYQKYSEIYPIRQEITITDPLPHLLAYRENRRSLVASAFSETHKTGIENGIIQRYNLYSHQLSTELVRGNIHNDVTDLQAGILGSLEFPMSIPDVELETSLLHVHPEGTTFTLSSSDWKNILGDRFELPQSFPFSWSFFPTLYIVGELDEKNKRNAYLFILQNSYRYDTSRRDMRMATVRQLREDLEWSDEPGIDYSVEGQKIVDIVQKYRMAAKILQISLNSPSRATVIAENNVPWDFNVYEMNVNKDA